MDGNRAGYSNESLQAANIHDLPGQPERPRDGLTPAQRLAAIEIMTRKILESPDATDQEILESLFRELVL